MHIPRPALSSYKTCRSCKNSKPFSEFRLTTSCRYGLNSKCKSCKGAIDKIWMNANAERARATRDSRRADKPEIARAEVRDWKRRNKDKVNAINANRRARNVGSSGRHTAADMAEIMLAQRGRCANPWCHVVLTSMNKHKDHRIPLKLGGSNDKSNMQWLCVSCNLTKAAHHPIDVAQKHGYLL